MIENKYRIAETIMSTVPSSLSTLDSSSPALAPASHDASAKVFRNGKNNDQSKQGSGFSDEPGRFGPKHDGREPCSYFMAGYCRYGAHCRAGVHDYKYGEAVRQHWLHPFGQFQVEGSPGMNSFSAFVRGAPGGANLVEKKFYPLYGRKCWTRADMERRQQSSAAAPEEKGGFAVVVDRHIMANGGPIDKHNNTSSTDERNKTSTAVFPKGGRSAATAQSSPPETTPMMIPTLFATAKCTFLKDACSAELTAFQNLLFYLQKHWADNVGEDVDALARLTSFRRARNPARTTNKSKKLNFRRSSTPEDRSSVLRRGAAAEVSAEESNEGPRPTPRIRPAYTTTPEFLLVLDLEGKDEITEFPVLVLRNGVEVGRFQRYVRPDQLFGEQHVFDEDCPSVSFRQVLQEFRQFLGDNFGLDLDNPYSVPPSHGRTPAATSFSHGHGGEKEPCWSSWGGKTGVGGDQTTSPGGGGGPAFAFVTCGDWDCKHVGTQCGISGIRPVPAGFSIFTNIKKLLSLVTNKDMRRGGMKSGLGHYAWLDKKGEVAFGFHHLGMHDVENIAMLMLRLLDEEVVCGGGGGEEEGVVVGGSRVPITSLGEGWVEEEWAAGVGGGKGKRGGRSGKK